MSLADDIERATDDLRRASDRLRSDGPYTLAHGHLRSALSSLDMAVGCLRTIEEPAPGNPLAAMSDPHAHAHGVALDPGFPIGPIPGGPS